MHWIGLNLGEIVVTGLHKVIRACEGFISQKINKIKSHKHVERHIFRRSFSTSASTAIVALPYDVMKLIFD